jgi:TonB family protein
MIQNNSTLYSLVGSLAVNMMLTMGAGSFLISINKSLATQKTYKLEFVKRKTPPPIKKKKIHKEIVRQEIKVASLQPKALPIIKPKTVVHKTQKKVVPREIKIASLQPKTLPTIQPKMTVRQTNSARPSVSIPTFVPRQVQTQKAPAMQSAKMHTSSSIMSRRVTTNIPTARSFASVNNKTSQKSTTRMAMVQGASHLKAHQIPKLVARTSASTSTSKGSKGRVSPVLTGMKHASLSFPSNPRGIPNIVDRGALKGYIGKIQRLIEGAKQYPEASRKAGREGKVKVQFTIYQDGKVDNIKLLTQTPYPNLNQEAMDAVKRAAPFSGFPDSLTEKSVKVILPFRFELH